jgi:c-di-AMP phosphodiesterase-like protein
MNINMFNRKDTKESLTLEMKTLAKRQSNIEKVVTDKRLVITALSVDPKNAEVQKIQESALSELEEMLVELVQKITETEIALCRY